MVGLFLILSALNGGLKKLAEIIIALISTLQIRLVTERLLWWTVDSVNSKHEHELPQ